jgi:hypothetical protein
LSVQHRNIGLQLCSNVGKVIMEWPAAEIDSKPGNLSAAKFAEFASDRFAAVC